MQITDRSVCVNEIWLRVLECNTRSARLAPYYRSTPCYDARSTVATGTSASAFACMAMLNNNDRVDTISRTMTTMIRLQMLSAFVSIRAAFRTVGDYVNDVAGAIGWESRISTREHEGAYPSYARLQCCSIHRAIHPRSWHAIITERDLTCEHARADQLASQYGPHCCRCPTPQSHLLTYILRDVLHDL